MVIRNVVRDGPNPVWALAKNIALYKTESIKDLALTDIKKKLINKISGEIKAFGFKKNFNLKTIDLQNLILLQKYEKFEWFVEVLTLSTG